MSDGSHNRYYQNPGDSRRNYGTHEANSAASMQGFNVNQSYPHYAAPNLNSYQQQYPTGNNYATNLSSQGGSGNSFSPNAPSPYTSSQYYNQLPSSGRSYNPSSHASPGSIPFLYTSETSNSTRLRGDLDTHIRPMLNQDNPLCPPMPNCSNLTQATESRPSHGVVRNHICPTCGKGFGRPSSLAQHEFIHTGEKPYVCSICGKAFNTTSNLKRHQSLHETT